MPAWWRGRKVQRRSERVDVGGRVLHLVDDAGAMRRQLDGEALDERALPPLRHDISTDEITPARICYHFDDKLGEFPYTGMVAGGEVPVGEGAVRRGGFVASVAGRRRGKGSSREASPFAEMSAGIRVAIAESFERIYEANCINLGLLTTTDLAVAEAIHARRSISLDAFLPVGDPVGADLVRYGGLFGYNVARLRGLVVPPRPHDEPRAMTIGEKILAAHWQAGGAAGVAAVAPGDSGFAAVDLRFSHEYVTPMSAAFWDRDVGSRVTPADPASILLFRDHLALLGEALEDRGDEAVSRLVDRLARRQAAFAHRHGIRLYDVASGAGGICHTVVLERHAIPGQVVLGTDSHTCQAGALGCLAIGCGATAMYNAWFTRDVRVRAPETVRIELTGAPNADVTAKDAMLLLLADPGVRGGELVGRILEFGGEGVRRLGLDERATLSNMAAEAGAFTGIIEADAAVVDLLAARGMPRSEAWRRAEGWSSDPGCRYERRIALDLDELEPLVATPGDPGNGRPARELEGMQVDTAYLGSCTGGKRADMDLAAAVFRWGATRGLAVHPRVRCFIQCASADVARYCEEVGHAEAFHAAGAVLVAPGCGACINAGPGVSRHSDEVTLSSINRNFPGRSGPGRMFLASTSTVAASALVGHLTTWPRLRRRFEA
jgi:3-benzylmalate isomerase